MTGIVSQNSSEENSRIFPERVFSRNLQNRKRMSGWLATLLLLVIYTAAEAQEFDVKISVNAPNVQIADASVFQTLEGQLNEFFNNHAWTDLQLKDFEKLRGNISITITKEKSATSFGGEMDVVISRPVYGTDYETTLLNYRDKNISFSYDPSRPITYRENAFTDNLSATLAFYAYFILGLDGDSFSLYGGDPYYKKAQEVARQVPAELQRGEDSGWSTGGSSRNRFQMVDEIFKPAMRSGRKAVYNYHRMGLDVMASNIQEARGAIMGSLHDLREVDGSEPNSMMVNIFFLAKASELNEIFAVSPRAEKVEAYNMIRTMDAANSQKYDKLSR